MNLIQHIHGHRDVRENTAPSAVNRTYELVGPMRWYWRSVRIPGWVAGALYRAHALFFRSTGRLA